MIKSFLKNLLNIYTVIIEPTNDCQLNCVTCYRKGRPVGYISEDTYDLALSKLPLNTYAVNLNGAGEPLMHPDFVLMVDKINSKRNLFKYKTGFSTNGLLLDSVMRLKILDKVDWINISIDGIGKNHESRRRGSNWETIKENVFGIIETPRKRTKISVNVTEFNHTTDEVAEVKEYFKDCDSFFVTKWHNAKMQVPGKTRTKCPQINNTMFILWNGDVTTCCGDLRGENVYGNIKDLHLTKRRGPLCKTCSYGANK